MRTVPAALILLLMLAAARAESWTLHRYAEDGFEVMLPGGVRVVPTELNEAQRQRVAKSTNYLLGNAEFAYMIGATQAAVTPNFEQGVRASFTAMGCSKIVRDVPQDAPGIAGRDIRGTGCRGGLARVEARYLLKGQWFYQVIAIFMTEGGDEAAARRFLDSFRLLDP